MLSRGALAAAFLAACRAELAALKPGNVHAHAGGHTMEVADFERSAAVAAPHIADPQLSVGEKILGAATATWAATGCNTNLGILLLCAPLAKAAERIGGLSAAGEDGGGLRAALHDVLATLTVADAAAAYRAIALMNPAGLGRVGEADVASAPAITLRQAMALAAGRDRIANAYVTDFAEIFDSALPQLDDAISRSEHPGLAVTGLHMSLLAHLPDSHIARKYGAEAAEAVRAEAAALAPAWQPGVRTGSLPQLLAFDASLKKRRLNPGTTADLVVATLFVNLIAAEIAAPGRI